MKKAKLRERLNMFEALRLPVISIILGILIGGLVIALSGYNPFAAIIGMFKGGFQPGYYLATTLGRATPIIFAGLAGAIAWGSGYPSLGAAGQMTLGALVSAITAVNVKGPAPVVLIVSLAAGAATGMLISWISAFICDKFEMWLLIITLMLNYVCDYAASYLTTYVFKDPFGSDSSAIQTQKIEVGILPKIISKFSLHYGFVFAVISVLLVLFIMKKTSFGYKAKMGGLNPHFAEYGGIKSKKMMYRVLLLSGLFAGLGGACEVLGTNYRYVDAMISSPAYAWKGVITTLMANNNPIGVFLSSVFLAGIKTGGSSLERSMGLSSEITSIIEGTITLLVTAKLTFSFRKKTGKTGNKEELK